MTSFRADEVVAERFSGRRPRAHREPRGCSAIARNAWTVCLTPQSATRLSEDFAAWLERACRRGGQSHSSLESERARRGVPCRLRRAALTRRADMPHQLARVVLVEQVYRALCVLQAILSPLDSLGANS